MIRNCVIEMAAGRYTPTEATYLDLRMCTNMFFYVSSDRYLSDDAAGCAAVSIEAIPKSDLRRRTVDGVIV